MARKDRKQHDPRYDRHHIRPKSRGGGSHRNLVTLPVEFHAAYHKLFVNMTVEEVHIFIDAIMQPDTRWSYRDLHYLRERIMHQRLAS